MVASAPWLEHPNIPELAVWVAVDGIRWYRTERWIFHPNWWHIWVHVVRKNRCARKPSSWIIKKMKKQMGWKKPLIYILVLWINRVRGFTRTRVDHQFQSELILEVVNTPELVEGQWSIYRDLDSPVIWETKYMTGYVVVWVFLHRNWFLKDRKNRLSCQHERWTESRWREWPRSQGWFCRPCMIFVGPRKRVISCDFVAMNTSVLLGHIPWFPWKSSKNTHTHTVFFLTLYITSWVLDSIVGDSGIVCGWYHLLHFARIRLWESTRRWLGSPRS